MFAPEISFLAPRYVLCLSDRKLLVMDSKALYVIRPNGRLECKLFEGEAERFRGLSYYRAFGRVVTTEKMADGTTHIVFIDVEAKKDVVETCVNFCVIFCVMFVLLIDLR